MALRVAKELKRLGILRNYKRLQKTQTFVEL